MVEKHDNDLYHGNGKPGITTRIQVCEERLDQMKETIDSMQGTLKAVAVMVGTTLFGVIIEIIVRLATK